MFSFIGFIVLFNDHCYIFSAVISLSSFLYLESFKFSSSTSLRLKVCLLVSKMASLRPFISLFSEMNVPNLAFLS